MAFLLRNTKGSPLTHAELDANFSDISNDSDATKGDALVGFKQSGTGAASRTVHDKLLEIEKTPQDYGGVTRTDIVEAITEIDAQSQNGFVRLPAATYGPITTGLTPPTFVDLVGDGRWNTSLEFALTSSGTCVNLEGADTNNRVRSSLRKMRIDGEDCTDSSVVGVSCNWNQQQQPVLDEVTIYGGYQSGGATTGLKNGLVLKEDGSNWEISFNEVGIEGCHGDGFVADTISGGAHNIINYWGGRIENNKGRNVYIAGPNDDIASFQINFIGTTFQGASYGTTGVASSVHVQGCKANFDKCWFEANASPNWATHEIRLDNGRVELHDCHIAWAQRGLFVQNGTAVLSGHNIIRSSTAGIVIGGNGRLVIRGEVEFLGAGTPIQLTDETSVIDWVRNRKVDKTANYSMSSSDIGSVISNFGSKQNITVTMALCPTGATLKVLNSKTSIRNSTYRWLASGSGTNEYYLDLAAGGNPGFSDPTRFYDFATSRTKGTLGALAASEWGYGDNDALGYSTIYYRMPSGADPDTATAGTLTVTYTVTIAPTNNQRLPLPATSPSDSIVSDGVPGTCMEMVMHAGTSSSGFWEATNANGTWT